jgi:CO/xanthine dehydrogenase FAD-binding subunit
VTTQEYFQPQTVEEAVNLLEAYSPELLVIAGGTIAIPLVNEGVSRPSKVMSLRRTGLNYFARSNGGYAIGATSTLTSMLNQTEIPMLSEAAHAVGGWAIRNMGTVGGNVFAPPPAGDFAVALLALDARLELASRKGMDHISLDEFYLGFMSYDIEPDEMVSEIKIPAPVGKTAYTKFGRRHANTPSVVTVAARVVEDGGKITDARLALNGVGPFPMRARRAEQALIGNQMTDEVIREAARLAAEESEPFTDAIASADYRRRMVDVFVRRTLEKIAG